MVGEDDTRGQECSKQRDPIAGVFEAEEYSGDLVRRGLTSVSEDFRRNEVRRDHEHVRKHVSRSR